MFDDKIAINIAQVKQLIAEQFPQWMHLEIKDVALSGWDNKTFHLGKNLSIRLPSHLDYASQVQKEHYWLPKLAPHLPLAISLPIAMGEPGAGYPLNWSIYRWLEGNTAAIGKIDKLSDFAITLAKFLKALQSCNTTGGPLAGADNFYRGGSLKVYDEEAQEAIDTLKEDHYKKAAQAVWDLAKASTWEGLPVWVHGDIA